MGGGRGESDVKQLYSKFFSTIIPIEFDIEFFALYLMVFIIQKPLIKLCSVEKVFHRSKQDKIYLKMWIKYMSLMNSKVDNFIKFCPWIKSSFIYS